MNAPLQFSIADEFFRAGWSALEREDLTNSEREQALKHIRTAKETFQLCLDKNPSSLNERLREDGESRIQQIRELLIESVPPDLG